MKTNSEPDFIDLLVFLKKAKFQILFCGFVGALVALALIFTKYSTVPLQLRNFDIVFNDLNDQFGDFPSKEEIEALAQQDDKLLPALFQAEGVEFPIRLETELNSSVTFKPLLQSRYRLSLILPRDFPSKDIEATIKSFLNTSITKWNANAIYLDSFLKSIDEKLFKLSLAIGNDEYALVQLLKKHDSAIWQKLQLRDYDRSRNAPSVDTASIRIVLASIPDTVPEKASLIKSIQANDVEYRRINSQREAVLKRKALEKRGELLNVLEVKDLKTAQDLDSAAGLGRQKKIIIFLSLVMLGLLTGFAIALTREFFVKNRDRLSGRSA